MLVNWILAVWIAASPAAAPCSEPEPAPSGPAPWAPEPTGLGSPAPAPPTWSPPQGTLVQKPPRGFVAIGGHYVEGEVDSPLGEDPDSDTALSIDVGMFAWNESLGIALELGYLASSYEIDVSSIASDDVDVARYLVGLRFADDEPQSLFLYHLRGGFLYREDEGDVLDDSGSGWYAGGGIEYKLPGGFSIGPQLLYTESSSLDATEWIAGIAAAYAF
jgi:hypothetical protein